MDLGLGIWVEQASNNALPSQLCNPRLTHPLHWKHPGTHPLIDRLSRVMVYKCKYCSRKSSAISSPWTLFKGIVNWDWISWYWACPAHSSPWLVQIATKTANLDQEKTWKPGLSLDSHSYGFKSKETIKISIYIHEQSMTLPSVDFADTT